MSRPRPNRLHDDLDALLDGRPVELTEELAPLVEVAGVLRAELAEYELDPAVAERHLERALDRSATVVRMPMRQQPNGWELRRRVVAIVAAAALVLAPATMASAAALPGQAMYPFKLAIEQVRLVTVQWSPAREAGERTRVADTRLDELQRLVDLRMFNQLPTAIDALRQAVLAARAAVDEARQDGAPVTVVAARLDRVNVRGAETIEMVASTLDKSVALPGGTRQAIRTAVEESKTVLEAPDREVAAGATGATPTPTTDPAAATGQTATNPTPPPSQSTAPTTTEPPATQPDPTTAPTTTAPPSSTEPPATQSTAAPPPPPNPGGPTAAANEQAADGLSVSDVPPTTGP
jgi:hypothetical protein